MGEFGRSSNVDKTGGWDHWPDLYSLLMAGGGIRGGRGQKGVRSEWHCCRAIRVRSL
jgi:hypothetical protein